jgi:hypothetical protein
MWGLNTNARRVSLTTVQGRALDASSFFDVLFSEEANRRLKALGKFCPAVTLRRRAGLIAFPHL